MTLVEPTRTPTPTPTPSGQRPEPVVITLDAVSKVYRSRRTAVPALDAISLTIPRHGFTCIVGASGCGKSTLLNLLAGLDSPTAGTLDVVGRTGLMFQESALFPWLTVTANVELALKLRKVPRADQAQPGRRVVGARAPVGLRRQAPARAVGRHAPACRTRPHARPGCRHPADGRTVRVSRRDDP